jgi:hypothetical protein
MKLIGESESSFHHEEHEGYEAISDPFLQALHVLHGSFSCVEVLLPIWIHLVIKGLTKANLSSLP